MSFFTEATGLLLIFVPIISLIAVLLIHSASLRLAALWLKLGEVSFTHAIRCALITLVTTTALKFQLGLEASFAASTLRAFESDRSYSTGATDYMVSSAIAPDLLSTVALLCVTAAILCSVIPIRDAEPPEISNLSYREAVALAAVSTALTVVVAGLLGFVVVSLFRLLI